MTKTTPTKAPATAAKVIIPEAILSYPKLFEPEPGPSGGDPKYGCTLVISDEKTLDTLKKAAIAVAKDKLGAEKAAKMIRDGKLKMPFIKSTEEDAGYPEGSTYIRPRTKNKPGIVSRFADPQDPKKCAKITDPAEMYPGVIVAASVVAFYYDTNGNKGISFALNNVQKLRDGERLAGPVPAEVEFNPSEDAVKDLSDLEAEDDANTDETDDGDDLADLLG